MLDDDVFKKDFNLVVDQLMGFTAATMTVTEATTTLMHLAVTDPEVLSKLRSEFQEHILTEGQTDISKATTYENIMDMEYFGCYYKEVLRWMPSAPFTSIYYFKEDTKIDGIQFKQGDQFSFNIYALQRDPAQWREPEKFVPERFDPKSEWFKKPNSNEKRHNSSWLPFMGGRRVCAGKTFAEIVPRVMASHLLHYFDFSPVDKNAPLPLRVVLKCEPAPAMMKFKLREGVW